MLTPNQIKNHTFNYARGNYKAVEVDTFMEEVLASYEQMFHENGELIKKLEAAAKRLEEYKTDEDKIKSALITAQKMADKMVSDAQSKSDKLTSDAEKKAKKTVNTAQDKADKLLAESNANAASTLESAENKANEVIESAKLLSDNVIAQAKEASEEIISNAKREVEISQNILNQIKVETDTFKKELLAKYQSHLE
ncbi:MAG: DivIVA domain-containing protein, partial [Clostridiales bacterium]|nr:DivIVA domain-containing protein [Clostridiales bacterium]